MAKDVECFFMYLLAIHTSFEKCFFQFICPFIDWIICFLVFNVLSSLYILGSNPLLGE
jgi:hypothetical protein